MMEKIIAFCATSCGEMTQNYGLFNNSIEMDKEFLIFCARMKSADVKVHGRRSVTIPYCSSKNNKFKYLDRNFLLVPVIPDQKYEIDGNSTDNDLLIIDMADINNLDLNKIPVTYLINGKFVCVSECISYIDRKILQDELCIL
jgi:hypothetical protein